VNLDDVSELLRDGDVSVSSEMEVEGRDGRIVFDGEVGCWGGGGRERVVAPWTGVGCERERRKRKGRKSSESVSSGEDERGKKRSWEEGARREKEDEERRLEIETRLQTTSETTRKTYRPTPRSDPRRHPQNPSCSDQSFPG